MGVARRFERDLQLPEVDLPDWELVEKIEELVRPYILEGTDLSFQAHDRRGTFTAEDVTALRDEADARGEEIDTLLIDNNAMESSGAIRKIWVQVWRSERYGGPPHRRRRQSVERG